MEQVLHKGLHGSILVPALPVQEAARLARRQRQPGVAVQPAGAAAQGASAGRGVPGAVLCAGGPCPRGPLLRPHVLAGGGRLAPDGSMPDPEQASRSCCLPACLALLVSHRCPGMRPALPRRA